MKSTNTQYSYSKSTNTQYSYSLNRKGSNSIRMITQLQRYNLILSILLVFILSLQNTLADAYARWNLPEGASLRLGKGTVGKLQFSTDGSRLVAQSSIGIWIYDAHTGTELKFIPENSFQIRAFNAEMNMYVTLNSDNSISVRNIIDGKVKITLEAETEDIGNISFSPDGNMLAVGIEHDIHLWDLSTGDNIAKLSGHTHWITGINFSPDGQTLASGSWDESVRLWDIANLKHIRTLTPRLYKNDRNLYGIDNILFSPDGKTLASASFNERMVHFWDTTTWQRQKSIVTVPVKDMAFSPDSDTLAICSYGSELHLYDVATAARKAELTRHLGRISSIAFSPDGKTLASGGLSELHLWDVSTGTQKLSINGHSSQVYGLAFAPDSQTIAAGGRHEIRLWDTITGDNKAIFYENDTLRSIVFSPDGKTLASEIGWSIRLWNVSDGTHQTTLTGYLGNGASGYGIASIAYSPDGRYLASGSSDSTVMIWHKGRTFKGQLIGHTAGLWSIVFSHDSRKLVSGGYDNTVRIWDVENANQIAVLEGHSDAVRCVAISPDGQFIASGSEDNTIIIWDTASGEQIAQLFGHPFWVTSVAFSTDGNTLASASMRESVIRLWDVPSGLPKKVLKGYSSSFNNLSFSPDGRTLASGSSDGTIILWELEASETLYPAEDVNRDGVVDINDLIEVAMQFGRADAENNADVNGDGIVDIADILIVAGALANGNAAPSSINKYKGLLTASNVQQWLSQAQHVRYKSPVYQKGIRVLEHLLSMLIPKKTLLLPNYPNPFNPETWIPYQLERAEEVTIHIHSFNGELIRTLDIGPQNAGIYNDQLKAAYWDGKNNLGETVASGIYFYTLSAGQFSSTRQMVIRK